jgi:hypothetical protein
VVKFTNLKLSTFTKSETAKLRLDEMYLIALAIDTDPAKMMFELCDHLQLKEIEE